MESPSSSQPASAQKGAVSGSVAAIPYTQPGVTGGEAALTSFADITETVAAQKVLATDHDRVQTILDYQPDPHVFAKAIRDEAGLVVDFRVTHANDAVGAIADVSTDVLVGLRASDFLPWKAGSELLARFVDVIENGEPHNPGIALGVVGDSTSFGRFHGWPTVLRSQ